MVALGYAPNFGTSPMYGTGHAGDIPVSCGKRLPVLSGRVRIGNGNSASRSVADVPKCRGLVPRLPAASAPLPAGDRSWSGRLAAARRPHSRHGY